MSNSKLIELTAVWEKKDKNGDIFMTGKLGKMSIIIMKNKFKKDEKHPDWRIFVRESQEESFFDRNKNNTPPEIENEGCPF